MRNIYKNAHIYEHLTSNKEAKAGVVSYLKTTLFQEK